MSLHQHVRRGAGGLTLTLQSQFTASLLKQKTATLASNEELAELQRQFTLVERALSMQSKTASFTHKDVNYVQIIFRRAPSGLLTPMLYNGVTYSKFDAMDSGSGSAITRFNKKRKVSRRKPLGIAWHVL